MHNFWAVLLVLPIFTWYSMFAVLDRNYTMAQQDVENIVYKYTQIAAKKGVLYQDIMDEMNKELDRYGAYETFVRAERFIGDAEPVQLTNEEVLGVDLRQQSFDLLDITVLYEDRHPVSVMYEYSVFGTPNGETRNFSLFGRASSYIW